MTGSQQREEDVSQPADASGRRMLAFCARVLGRHPWLMSAFVLAAAGVAAADVLSLALVFPFIMALGGSAAAFPEGFALGFLGAFFEGMSVEEKIRTIAVMLVGLQLARGLLSYAESRINGYVAVMFERDVRQIVFDDLLRVELRWIHKQKTANLFTIMHSYPRESARLMRDYLGGLSRVITGTALVVTLFDLDWRLTLIALGLGLASLLVVTQIRRVIKRLGREMRDTRVALQQTTLESLQSMKAIRLFAREEYAAKRFQDEVRALQRQSYQTASFTAAAAPLQRILNTLLFAGLLFAATYVLAQSGEEWLALLTVFIMVIFRLMAPLSNFAQRSARIASETPALEAVVGFLDQEKPYLKEGTREFTRLKDGVRFESVTFRYEPDRPPVLDGVSFDLPRGRTVALVGESGSGKSTLVQLLSRLSDPSEGRILVDGVDLRDLRSASWRQRVAVVSQDTHLFNATVRENIRFGRLEATDEEIERAARLAQAHEFIAAMEQGYDTRVGERGVRLSGGQAQRIAIARAILADPDVLVLDEATSALDTATERGVQDALETVSRERTVLAIAHRLSTIRHADLILVMDAGRIVERGTHDELMARGGVYARLVRMQDVTGDVAPRARAIPVQSEPRAPRPSRVTIGEGASTARVEMDDGSARELPVLVGGARDGDAVHLVEGVDGATVRLAGSDQAGVPLFLGEKRVRVRTARGEGAPSIKLG